MLNKQLIHRHTITNSFFIVATMIVLGSKLKSAGAEQNTSIVVKNPPAEIVSLSFEYDEEQKRVWYDARGTAEVLENIVVRMRLYGKFSGNTNMSIKLTNSNNCERAKLSTVVRRLKIHSSLVMASVLLRTPKVGDLNEYEVCIGISEGNSTIWHIQESAKKPWLSIRIYGRSLPLYFHVTLILLLLLLSGLFSGLNLGLMALNKTDLKIIIKTGTVSEKKYAEQIAPVRNHGNFLLCALLFSNVLVNSSLTILVDDLTSGIIAIMMSTLAIVLFGEIFPQALCSRFGLLVGAKTIIVTKFFMFITFGLAYPLSKLLDCILGEEIGNIYTRERLKELLQVTKDHHGLATEEVGIISGALDMQRKTVKDIMTKLDKVYKLPIDAVMDFDTMAEINYHGFSRIPVYDTEKSNMVALLNVKQLTLLDPSDNIPLRTVIQYYHNPLFFVFENTRLDYMFRAFREGSRGHLAFVQKVNDDGPGEPYCETIGIVTMEDVLEELLQAEIMDENDVGKLEAKLKNQKLPNRGDANMRSAKVHPTVYIPQTLTLAAIQFLSTSVQPFYPEYITESILERIVRNTICVMKAPKQSVHSDKNIQHLYECGVANEYFSLILEGRVQVQVGQDKLIYEGGPFTSFGAPFLLSKSNETFDVKQFMEDSTTKTSKIFIPDYTVQVLTDIHYMRLKYNAYQVARMASEFEKSYRDPKKSMVNPKNWEDIETILQTAFDDDQTPDL